MISHYISEEDAIRSHEHGLQILAYCSASLEWVTVWMPTDRTEWAWVSGKRKWRAGELSHFVALSKIAASQTTA